MGDKTDDNRHGVSEYVMKELSVDTHNDAALYELRAKKGAEAANKNEENSALVS